MRNRIVVRIVSAKVPPLLAASGKDDEEMDFGAPVDSYDAKRANARAWIEEEDNSEIMW